MLQFGHAIRVQNFVLTNTVDFMSPLEIVQWQQDRKSEPDFVYP